MISKQRALFFFVGDQSFKDLPSAQIFDLKQLIPEHLVEASVNPDEDKEEIVKWMLSDAEKIVDILTTTPTSRLKARKTHGGTKIPARKKLQPAMKLEQKSAVKKAPESVTKTFNHPEPK